MLARRIIPCLDVKEGKVVKGVRFREHKILGDVLELADLYRRQGADELVFYDITASAEDRSVSLAWVKETAELLDIPFCVAGGIRSVAQAGAILNAGADKISVNSPAIERPELISELAQAFGSQAIVVGIDSERLGGDFIVHQYTGSETRVRGTGLLTLTWAKEAEDRGAGELVLNCMSHDGVGKGYDLEQLDAVRARVHIPLVASGGAGAASHFVDVFTKTRVDAALAAGVFHRREIAIPDLKQILRNAGVPIRP